MTRSEREHLIEQYLDGAMSVEQEHDLFIEAATNKELRAELKAYRIIDSALRKDGAVEPTGYSAVRARMQGLLATATAAGRTTPREGRPGHMRSRDGRFRRVASKARQIPARLASVPMRMLMVVTTAAACTIGTLIVLPLLPHADEPSQRPMSAPGTRGVIVSAPTSVGAALAGATVSNPLPGIDPVLLRELLPGGIADASPESATLPPDRGLHRERRSHRDRLPAPQPAASAPDAADRPSTNRRIGPSTRRSDNPRIPFIIQTPRREK